MHLVLAAGVLMAIFAVGLTTAPAEAGDENEQSPHTTVATTTEKKYTYSKRRGSGGSKGGRAKGRYRTGNSGQSSSDDDEEDGREPCVGLCHYRRVLALEKKRNMLAKGIPIEKINKYLAAKKKAREEKMAVHGEPCIGVCQHYRANGIDDPFKEASYQEPCIGLCQYFRAIGKKNPFEST